MKDSRLSRAWLLVLAGVAACEHGNVVQPPPPRSVVHFMSPTGSAAGDGSSAHPWDLATALKGAAERVAPGDTIWLRGGTYMPTAPLVSSVAGAPKKSCALYTAYRSPRSSTAERVIGTVSWCDQL